MAATTYRDFPVEVAGVEVTVHLISIPENGIETCEVEFGASPFLDFALRGTPTLADLTAQIERVLFTD